MNFRVCDQIQMEYNTERRSRKTSKQIHNFIERILLKFPVAMNSSVCHIIMFLWEILAFGTVPVIRILKKKLYMAVII